MPTVRVRCPQWALFEGSLFQTLYTDLTEADSHLPFFELRKETDSAYSGVSHVWPGIPPPGRGWELVFRLQAQAGAQSLDAKATVGHGHGHLCGDPGKGDFPREMAKET